MSDNSSNDLDLNVHFLPDWAKQGSNKNIYEKYSGSEEVTSGRPPRRGDGNRSGNRPRPQGGSGGGGGHDRPRRGRGPGQGGGGAQGQQGGPRGGRRQQGGNRNPRFNKREQEPLPEIDTAFIADEAVANSLAEQIKITARAYPLFSIAQMILSKPDRYSVRLTPEKNKSGEGPARKLYVCALDDTVWLNQADAVNNLMKNHLGTFYESIKTEAEPPKGTYTFVAQCGMSGVILGPPNYHDYQNQLRKLFTERFENKMSFERFKSRVKIVKDEETVNKWLEEQSFVITYKVLNSPEQLILNSWDEVMTHFNENHLPNLVSEVTKHSIPGNVAENYPCSEIRRLVRVRLAEQKRFPLKVVNLLSQQFSAKGLQFFKVNKSVTHVCVSRPHYLDLDSTNVKDGIRRIIGFIHEHPGCNRKQLIDSLAGGDVAASVAQEAVVNEEAPVNQAPVEEAPPSQPTATEPEAVPAPEATQESSAAGESAPVEPSAPAAASAHVEPSSEQKAVISDLHWLLYQGNVIEFASGILEVAKKPIEKKKPAPAPKAENPSSDESSAATSEAQKDSGTPEATEVAPTESAPAPSESSDQPLQQPDPETPAAENTEQPQQSEEPAAQETSEASPENVDDTSDKS